MGAADYAEDPKRYEPPPQLLYYFQMRDFPGSLPEPGGLRDQPAGLIQSIRRAGRIWTIFDDFNRAKSWKQFQQDRPEDYKLKHKIDELRRTRDAG